MPFIEVKVAGKLSREQKEKIVREITQIMTNVCAKPPEATYVVIQEVARSNWAKAGVLLE